MNLEAPEGSMGVPEVRIPVYVLVLQGKQEQLIHHEMERWYRRWCRTTNRTFPHVRTRSPCKSALVHLHKTN